MDLEHVLLIQGAQVCDLVILDNQDGRRNVQEVNMGHHYLGDCSKLR